MGTSQHSVGLGVTPAQTVGPFFAFCLPWPDGPYAAPEDMPGAITIHGRLLDGAGDPVPDGLIETWQADPAGRFAHPDDPRGAVEWERFRGFARCPTDDDGSWQVMTLKPGPIPDSPAPYLAVSVFARGLLHRLVTRIYFADEAEVNAADPVLASLPSDAARETLLAVPDQRGYRFDIVLQGDNETVFFAI
jgi:protocatechuate 3,4-dioxygenase alpha subunit